MTKGEMTRCHAPDKPTERPLPASESSLLI
jgi:hypothetical protein